MHQTDVDSWEDFVAEIAKLRAKYAEYRALRFRGLADSGWDLTTTSERYGLRDTSFDYYYRLITSVQPHIRSFTADEWDLIEPYYPDIRELVSGYDSFHTYLWGGQLKALGYMAYLRHHGFPSPLMDWTRSPYVAAFFSFRSSSPPASGGVAVYAYCETPEGMKSHSSDEPYIFPFGPSVRTHRRHHLQQGEYTACLQWEQNSGWRFVQHDSIFSRGSDRQDALWKFTIPWTERVKVLTTLDDHNVNAFSLFESNEALLETLALRRVYLERRD